MPAIAIIVDNCGGQNKNNVTIRFLNMIKKGGLFGTATFHFYIKGHTKNGYDCAFKSLKVLYRNQNVFTFEKWCENFNTSTNVEVIQMFHETFFDLESFLNDLYNRPDPKTVKFKHVFQVKKESSHIGYHQEFHGESESKENYKKENYYRGAQKNRIIRNIFKHLKHP